MEDIITILSVNVLKMLVEYDEELANFFDQLDEIDRKEFLSDLQDIIYDWSEKYT